MCGITGLIDPRGTGETLTEAVRQMAGRLAHRGPDDAGEWVAAPVALAHRRLAIVDLSPAGHQPMTSACGRFVLVFNGEIYNHQELRKALPEVAWRGHSDTETLLAALSVWGVVTTLRRSVGMFALALWDAGQRCLILARDRMGEKPLYYGWQQGVFLFGSELKALRVHPAFEARVDRDALTQYLRFNYIPSPRSIYQGIRKLPPGTWLTLPVAAPPESWPQPQAYWRVLDAASAARQEDLSDRAAVEELDGLLGQVVAGQMLADVPLGAFLSGGVDSSTVAALMQARSSRPVQTFTIGFHEDGYNEARHALAVATHLGCRHTELYVTPEQAMDVIPALPILYDEPFADASQIPTFLVSRLARQRVTVCLSGDGGDELFAGYLRYIWAARIWRGLGSMPRVVRLGLAGLLAAVPPEQWNALLGRLAWLLPPRWRYAQAGDKLHKLAEILTAHSPDEVYQYLVSQWKRPDMLVPGGTEPLSVLTDGQSCYGLEDMTERMMALDQQSYLPDDILVKVDRAAMGVALETRVPLLDHRVVEYAWRLPMDMKIRSGESKWLLRQVLYRYVPRELIERPKMGFGVPIDVWLRGPLRPWAEALLNEDRLLKDGYLDPDPIRARWQEHLSGRHNWCYPLWTVLMFQAWLEQNVARDARRFATEVSPAR